MSVNLTGYDFLEEGCRSAEEFSWEKHLNTLCKRRGDWVDKVLSAEEICAEELELFTDSLFEAPELLLAKLNSLLASELSSEGKMTIVRVYFEVAVFLSNWRLYKELWNRDSETEVAKIASSYILWEINISELMKVVDAHESVRFYNSLNKFLKLNQGAISIEAQIALLTILTERLEKYFCPKNTLAVNTFDEWNEITMN